MLSAMNPAQLTRYGRHLLLPQVGKSGQNKLLQSHALVIGAGGLGCPAAMYLSAAGVGQLTLADFDIVELSNLQRQIGHRTADIGQLKTTSLKQTCTALNPDIEIHTIDHALDEQDLEQSLSKVDIVLDCSDNFPTRFAVNEACVSASKPLISGAAMRGEGQIALFDMRHGPCYRCLYRDTGGPQETCEQTGVLAPLVGVIGTMQATLAMNVLLYGGHDYSGQLWLFESQSFEWRQLKLRRDPHCPICSDDGRVSRLAS